MKKSILAAAVFGLSLLSAGTMKAADVCSAVANNLVANCGFESGDFTSWTLAGNTDPVLSDSGVDASDAWSGSFGAYLHAAVTPVTLSQTIATAKGNKYAVTFWLANGAPADPSADYHNAVNVSFGAGKYTASEQDIFGYTALTFVGEASGSSSDLLFSLRNDAGYYSLDSVSVVLTSVSPEPASLLLALPALGVFWLSRKRKRG
jgi:hypothetical protein